MTRDDRKLPLAVEEFREMAAGSLSERDRRVMDLFFLTRDNAAVLRLLRKETPGADSGTVYPLAVLEGEVTEPTGALPAYLERFIADFREERLPEGVLPENVLSGMYYDYLLGQREGFVRRYAEFSLNVKNLVTALNCRKHGREIAREVSAIMLLPGRCGRRRRRISGCQWITRTWNAWRRWWRTRISWSGSGGWICWRGILSRSR